MTIRELSDLVLSMSKDSSNPRKLREDVLNTVPCCWYSRGVEDNDRSNVRIAIEDDVGILMEDLDHAGFHKASFKSNPNSLDYYVLGKIRAFASVENLLSSGIPYVSLQDIYLNEWKDEYVNESGVYYDDNFRLRDNSVEYDNFLLSRYFSGYSSVDVGKLPYLDPDLAGLYANIDGSSKDMRVTSKYHILDSESNEFYHDLMFRRMNESKPSSVNPVLLEYAVPFRSMYGVWKDYSVTNTDFVTALVVLRDVFRGSRAMLIHIFRGSSGVVIDDLANGFRYTRELFVSIFASTAGLFRDEGAGKAERVRESIEVIEKFIVGMDCDLFLLGTGVSSKPTVYTREGIGRACVSAVFR